MDWEYLTGLEGEELDGYFPEPDDTISYTSCNDWDYDCPDTGSHNPYWEYVMTDFLSIIFQTKGILFYDRDDLDKSEVIAEKVDDILSTSISSIDSPQKMEELVKEMEDCLIFECREKEPFLEWLDHCMKDPELKNSLNVLDVLDGLEFHREF